MVNTEQSAGRPSLGGPLFCARYVHALVCAALFTLSLQASSAAAALQNTAPKEAVNHTGHQCAFASNTVAEPAEIHSVVDGDTVVLTDQRKVRVIGINAPELSKKSERALYDEASAAQALIENRIANNPSVNLVLGDEAKDRYGRLLAHVIFADGSNFATELLARGLAAATAVSPNTRCADHYQRIELTARNQKRGVWQHTNNPWYATDLPTRQIQGFHLITDQVEDVRQSKKLLLIQLRGGVTVSASPSVLSKDDALALRQKTIEVRGWFGRSNGQTRVRLHHAANLSVRP